VTEGCHDRRHVTIHLTAQATVEFGASQLWPRDGEYSRFGLDLGSFALEVTRRLHSDAYVGFCTQYEQISVIPLSAIKRIDFVQKK
jgi:hypothetical protein